MKRHVARLAELRATDRHHTIDEVNVGAVELQGFVASHARSHIQTKEGGVGVRSQASGGRQLLSGLKQPSNLIITINIRSRTLVLIGNQIGWWNDRTGIGGATVLSKTPYHTQPERQGAWMPRRSLCPRARRIFRYSSSAMQSLLIAHLAATVGQ